LCGDRKLMPMKNFWILGILLVVWGCKTSAGLPQVDASTFSGYQENLSERLPDFPDYSQALQQLNTSLPASSQSVDGQLEERMRSGYEKTKGEPYFSGLRCWSIRVLTETKPLEPETIWPYFFRR